MKKPKFNFTDEEFLAVMNLICKADTPFGEEYTPITSMNTRIDMGRLDSLSMMVFFVWLSKLFGIPEAKIQDFSDKQVFTINAIKAFVTKEFTKTATYAEVQEYAKRCF
jgi:hypothetical protein|tara:strand:+ start:18 stop:344 length:327 start_codon:yes stop_codon:yes gene_type:complete